MSEQYRVGVIGCGAISAAYLKMAAQLPILQVVACADLERAKAQARADEFGVPRVCEVDELLADDAVDIVLNLTVPQAHAPLELAALEHGKHTYTEKPLATSRDEGRQIVAAAERTGCRVGCAPDTVLGAGMQTARKLIDDGGIGEPVAFTGFNLSHGHETWHANPGFFYQPGGGPMFDMGPYYLTALLNLLGPVRRITGLASIAIGERTITSEPRRGERIHVTTPDHICGTLEFVNGAVGTLVTSFATWHPLYDRTFPITVYGTEGTLRVPDPNQFDGPVQVRGSGDDEWREVPHAFPTGYGRAIGLADLAHALRSGRSHRCSLEQAYCVLDLMQGFLDASASGQAYLPERAYERPRPMPTEGPFGVLDD